MLKQPISRVTVFFGLILLSLNSLWAAPPEGYDFLPLTQAMQQAAAQNRPMLLYFGRYGCSTCRKMHQEVFIDAALHNRLSSQFVLAYVDTESGNRIRLPNGERTTEMQFAASNRILGTPTFTYFSNEQQPLFQRAGFQSIQQMTNYSDFVSEGHYKKTTLKDYLASR